MYLLSELHGHGSSSTPSSTGHPTEWRQGTNSPSSPSTSSAPWPIRVMIRMDTATYAESVSCTPTCAIGEPSGPIENGTTYMVRPRIEPRKRPLSVSRISPGSRQLFVGPASDSRSEQMKVRSSTRATSPGSERARYEFGRLASDSFSNVPASTRSWQSRSYSSAEPSHQWIASGWVSSATSATQEISFAFLVGTSVAALVSLKLWLNSFLGGDGSSTRSGPPGTDRAFCRTALRNAAIQRLPLDDAKSAGPGPFFAGS